VTGEAPEEQDEQEKYVFITRITAAGRTRFVEELQGSVNTEGAGSILLFVHGFNTGFDSALIRSAQLTFDLRQNRDASNLRANGFNPGAPVLFTWPSQGQMSVSAYRQDEIAAEAAAPRLEEFLDLLTTDLRVRRVNIIAHSMGNRVLTRALESFAEDYLARHPERGIEFRIILAAADLERDVYRLAADKIGNLEPNVTIYTSDADRALQISRVINGVRRLGQTDHNRPFIRLEPNYSTIDATPVATELFGVGHDYYSDNPFILNDIRCAMANRPVRVRALQLRRYNDAPDGDPYFRVDAAVIPEDQNCSLRRDQYLQEPDRGAPDEPAPPPPPPPPPPPSAFEARQFIAYFGSGQSDLTAEGTAVVDASATYLRAAGRGVIRLTAHTDTSGSPAVNDLLARQRAEAVRMRLVAMGVDPARIVIEVSGERDPAVPTGDGVPEPLNRRVVIEIRFD
jgi:esterase/lipase superfamily enzyme/outer membrane protein OmpA-like peptidoglycan-associated protein